MPPLKNGPVVTKQSPRDTQPNAPQGSLLSQAVPVSELEDVYIKMVIYGGNRVGKTTLACGFPKPLLLISMEGAPSGGARSVKKIPGVTYISKAQDPRVVSKNGIAQLADELSRDTYFKTIVLDSITSYQDIVLKEILKLPAVPEQLNWGSVTRDEYRMRSEQTREGLRPFADHLKHTVFLAKEKDHNPPDKDKPEILRGIQDGSFFAADLGGGTVGWLHDVCDFITRMYVEETVIYRDQVIKIGAESKKTRVPEFTGKYRRYLRLNWHKMYAAGFRTDTPANIPDYMVDPSFEKLFTLIKGGTIKNE